MKFRSVGNMSKSTGLVKRNDYYRVLVTETLPYETPAIFSNDGFYRNCKTIDGVASPVAKFIFRSLVVGSANDKYTIPYRYKIRKNSTEVRALSLLHPMSQWKIMNFYEKYEDYICHWCAQSPASIRAPTRVAGSYFYKNPWANINQYKKGGVLPEDLEYSSKHSSSFFIYSGHDRLYKFFGSDDFFKLEKKFSDLLSIDVSKCFDSIYTHSISWAVKDKSYVKRNVRYTETFGQNFDGLMQRLNYNETNGVVIGPEVSRIFAEVIFQRIDCQVIIELEKKHGLRFGENFAIRRYVDDIYIFTNREADSQLVYDIYTKNLSKYNLHINVLKNKKLHRPFLTKKSKVTIESSIVLNEFLSKFTEDSSDRSSLVPIEIRYRSRLIKSFIDSVKAVCANNQVAYDEVSSYLISSIFERVKKLINVDLVKGGQNIASLYRDALLTLLEVAFFLYSVSPSVNSSYKLSASIILINRFSEKHLGDHASSVKQKILELSIDLLSDNLINIKLGVDDFVLLEGLNILLAISELGDDYLLPEDLAGNIFNGHSASYYGIVSGLFYAGNNEKYKNFRLSLNEKIDEKIMDLTDIKQNTEKACLFLDALSCPYLKRSKKMRWVKRFYAALGEPLPLLTEIHDYIELAESQYWFINWHELDLLNALERKELKRAY